MNEVKVRIAVAILAILMSNWPVLAFFRDGLLGYLYAAWFAVIVLTFLLSHFSAVGKVNRKEP